jgi:putative CocE/NonD family hydrolase
MVETRDGVALATDVYLPDGDGPFPAILTRLPYGKTEAYCDMPGTAKRWNAGGYAFVVQDNRGKWDSGGTFDASDIDMEAKDGCDTIDWIREQSWSNGSVGMWGESYYGYTCFAAASLEPEGLICIAPGDQGFDRYHWSYRSGCLRLASEGIWGISIMGRHHPDTSALDLWHLPLADIASAAGLPCTYFDDVVAHPERGMRYWQARNRLDDMLAIDIPMLQWTGWYDNFMGHVIEEWHWLRGADTPARRNHLLIGPWDHDGTPDRSHRIGLSPIDERTLAHRWDKYLAFFDRYMKGSDNGFEAAGSVHYYTLGANEWRDADAWPPAGVAFETWYLHSSGFAGSNPIDGHLDQTAPDDEPADRYTYDPADPVAWTFGTPAWEFCEAMGDRQDIEARPDVLTYTSRPLDEPLEITGPVSATLHIETDAPDTDFTVALVDVFPDGRVNLIQDGIQRAALREPSRGRQLLRQGGVYEIPVDMWSISYRLPAGHRLRIEVSSSEFSRYDRNPNTAAPFGQETRPVKARQTIHHNATHPSRVLLPIMRQRQS